MQSEHGLVDAFDYIVKPHHNPFVNVTIESALIIGARTDLLFPPDQQQEIVQLFNEAGISTELNNTDSIQGHDAFLVDKKVYSTLIKDYLDQYSFILNSMT